MRPQRVHNFGTYFVTTSTWRRRRLFQVERHAQLLVRILYTYAAKGEYRLHEFVVMKDHIHLLLTPAETLERAMQLIKGGFSRELSTSGCEGEVWQKGFTDHRVRDYDDYIKHRDYIHKNPVVAGYCVEPGGFTYSSAHPGYKLDPIPQRLKPISLSAAGRHG